MNYSNSLEWRHPGNWSVGRILLLCGMASVLSRACIVTHALEVTSAATGGNPNGLGVTFSVPVDSESALTLDNYHIEPGIAITKVTLVESAKVRLETSEIREGQVYSLTVRNVRDTADPPEAITPGTKVSFLQTQGVITRKEYHGIAGVMVSDLTSHAKFPDKPDLVGFSTSFETPVDVRDNYGVLLQGHVTAPASGDYAFYLNSDDQGLLYLSTDENPANKRPIASEPQWNGSRQFITGSNQYSRFVTPPELFASGLFIEAEDFDFDGGKSAGPLSADPYSGGTFAGRSANAGVDYHDPGANESVVYRAATQGVALIENGDRGRGSFDVEVNYKVGFCEADDWLNYTRTFPLPRTEYYVLARLSSGGNSIAARLDEVIGGVGTPSQVLSTLGTFEAPTTSGWDNFALVPLRDRSGQPVKASLGGNHTLRFTVLPGNLDFNYLLFRPASLGLDADSLSPRNISRPIHLEAGRKYYIEALMKEAGGGDNLAVAWRKPGDSELANGAAPISGEFLSAVNPSVPVTVLTQPDSQTVPERGSVAFTTVINGTPPYDIQWLRNGQMIPGANQLSYTLGSVQASDHQTVFHCLVGNGISSTSTAGARLSVTLDTTPPTLAFAEGSVSFDRVKLTFSEPLDPSIAQDASRYRLDGGLIVTGARLLADRRTVELTTTPQTPGQKYSVTVNGLADTAATPNIVAPNTQRAFSSFVLSRGAIRRQAYFDLGDGDQLIDLTSRPKFPDSPDEDGLAGGFEGRTPNRRGTGQRFTGFLLPPATGDYLFYLSSSNDSVLLLSTDEEPANVRPVAREYLSQSFYDWVGTQNRDPVNPANRSAPIRLEAGRKYYVEARVRTNPYNPGHLAVTWRKPGDPAVVNGDPPIPGVYLATYVNPDLARIAIQLQPGDVTVAESESALFKVRARGTPELVSYQWQRNGVDILNAVSPDYQTPPVTSGEDGAKYRCQVFVPGASTFSEEVVLRVVTETTPPQVTRVDGGIGLDEVKLRFSEPLDPIEASTSSNYSVDGGLSVLSAKLWFDGKTVVLKTTPQTSGRDYNIRMNKLRDLAGNPIPSDMQVRFTAWEPEEFAGPFSSWAEAKRDFGAKGDGIVDDTDALQAALDLIAADAPSSSLPRPSVLYLPSGIYRITRRLDLWTRLGPSVVGEHPETTVIRWDGPAEGVMLWMNGATLAKVSRLTFDGAAKAKSAIDYKWDRQRPFSTSATEFSDLIVKDLQFGVRGGFDAGGGNDDGSSILRCRFLRCSNAAVVVESSNAVNWWVWDSLFEDCGIGILNARGGCNAYRSVFRRSKDCDVKITFCGAYFSYRENTSVGSAAFVKIEHVGCAQLTMQGNVILEPSEPTPVRLRNSGPAILLDNVFRPRLADVNQPMIDTVNQLTLAGNVTSAERWFGSVQQVIDFDNQSVPQAALADLAEPALPGFPQRGNRRVFEVPADWTDGKGLYWTAHSADIQAVIDEATRYCGERPIVHLHATAGFRVDKTLEVPAGCDIQMVGDGIQFSTLGWSGAEDGTILRLHGPSKVTLRDLRLHDDWHARALEVADADQPGGRVFFGRTAQTGARAYLTADRLDHTIVDVRGINHGGDLVVRGGDLTRQREATAGTVNVVGAQGYDTEKATAPYQVERGGRLVVQDDWYETAGPLMLGLTDAGAVTLHGMRIAPDAPDFNDPAGPPAVDVNGFNGSLALLQGDFNWPATRLRITGQSQLASVLVLGSTGRHPDFLTDEDSAATYAFLHSPPALNQGNSATAFVRRMLAQTREAIPADPVRTPPGVTDVRIERVQFSNSKHGTLITRSNIPPVLAQPLEQTIDEGDLLSVKLTATDVDQPYQQLRYFLEPGAPFDAQLDPESGLLTWQTFENHGPGDVLIGVGVSDNGAPPRSDKKWLRVTLREINQTPQVGVAADLSEPIVEHTIDIGTPTDPKYPGTFTVLPDGSSEMVGSGSAIQYIEKDHFYFAYRTFTADFDARVKVSRLEATHQHALAGLMIREELTMESRYVGLAVTPDWLGGSDSYRGIYRDRAGAQSDFYAFNQDARYPNAWMRFERIDQTFIAYRSDDGLKWLEIGRFNPANPYPATVYLGLWVCDFYEGQSKATLQNIEVRRPGVVAFPDIAAAEGNSVSLKVAAADTDLPANSLLFSLGEGTPAGAAIDPTSGIFTWTPGEAQGPGNHSITIKVSDNGVPPLSSEQTFTVMVSEVNSAPALAAISVQPAGEGVPFTFTPSAVDADLPANKLAWSLGTGAPAGMKLDAATGVISWTPGETQGGSSFPVTVTVTDDGVPPLSDSKTFHVTVAAAQKDIRVMGMKVSPEGQFSFSWSAQAGHAYEVQFKNRLDDAEWTGIQPVVMATGDAAEFSEPVSMGTQRFYRVTRKR